MNTNNDPETPIFNQVANKVKRNFFTYAKKGFVSGFAAIATSIVATVPPQVTDGVFTMPEFWFTFTVAIGAGFVGFFAAYIPTNHE